MASARIMLPLRCLVLHFAACSDRKIMSTRSKANATLTPSEKESKWKLKAELKFQSRVRKLQTRVDHAVSRNDPAVERSAREDLEELLSTRGGDGNDDVERSRRRHRELLCPSIDARGRAALDEALAIFRRLLASIDDDDKEKIRDEKMRQTGRAKHLLKNMTKGTQSKPMFQDVTALRGYARQKFHERAALVIESLGKLSPTSMEAAMSITHGHDNTDSLQKRERMQQQEVMAMCWEKLGGIERVCSLGCGPGNDAVGVTAFHRAHFDRKDGVREIFLLDFAMDEWRGAVLDDLIPILMPEYVDGVACARCDVTNPLSDSDIERCVERSDIFLASYLLTETRNRWDGFLVRLMGLAKPGSLFYFSEPVPWQLHRLMRISSTGTSSDGSPGTDRSPLRSLRFVWIDSSMHFPEMQELDRRVGGPAVLLAIKV